MSSKTSNSETFSTLSSNPSLKTSPPSDPDPKGCTLSESPRTRKVYLAARIISSVLGIVLIILAVVAKHVLDRSRWLTPILSPAINTLCASGVDIGLILWTRKRAPRLQRLFHDGAIGIGCAVAGGFMIAFTREDIMESRLHRANVPGAVAVLILIGMFMEM